MDEIRAPVIARCHARQEAAADRASVMSSHTKLICTQRRLSAQVASDASRVIAIASRIGIIAAALDSAVAAVIVPSLR